MFDPAAIGTLTIGLDHLRREEERYARGIALPPRPRRGRLPILRRFATTLRRAADLIDPTPAAVPARTSEGV